MPDFRDWSFWSKIDVEEVALDHHSQDLVEVALDHHSRALVGAQAVMKIQAPVVSILESSFFFFSKSFNF